MENKNYYEQFPKKIDSTAVVLNIIFNLASVGITKTTFSDIREGLKKTIHDILYIEKEVENALLYASLFNYVAFNKENIIITISKEEALEKIKYRNASVLVKKERDK